MSETRVGRESDLFGKVRCELHPKQARYQASLQPDSQEQRLDSSTWSSADVSGFARRSFGGVSERPSVTKALPALYKLADEPVGSGRQTFLEYVLIAPVPVQSQLRFKTGTVIGYMSICSQIMTIGATPRFSARANSSSSLIMGGRCFSGHDDSAAGAGSAAESSCPEKHRPPMM